MLAGVEFVTESLFSELSVIAATVYATSSTSRNKRRGEEELSLTTFAIGNTIVFSLIALLVGGAIISLYYFLIALMASGSTFFLFVLPALTLALTAGVI